MRVFKIELNNIMGVRELEYELGSVTEITGANDLGKTSVVSGLLALIGGGSDVTLLRKGEKKGYAALLLDGGDGMIELRKTWSDRAKPALRILRDGKPIPDTTPQAFIDGLFDRLVNPIDFLSAKPADQARWLLEAMPMNVTAKQLEEAVGRPGRYEDLARKHALEAIDALHSVEYESRRQANVAALDKRKTEQQLKSTLPKVANIDHLAAAAALSREEGELRSRLATAETTAAAMLETEESAADREYLQAKGLIDRTLDEEIAAAKDRHRAALNQARNAKDVRIDSARTDKDRTVAAATAEINARLNTIAGELAASKAAAAAAAAAAAQRTLYERLGREAADLERTSAQHDDALDRLAALKNRLLETLPIPGLEMKAGKFFKNGIPIERLNTAQQVDLAVDVAELRAGRAGLIVIDGMERLDREHYEAFVEKRKQSGLQYICTRVADPPADAQLQPEGFAIRSL